MTDAHLMTWRYRILQTFSTFPSLDQSTTSSLMSRRTDYGAGDWKKDRTLRDWMKALKKRNQDEVSRKLRAANKVCRQGVPGVSKTLISPFFHSNTDAIGLRRLANVRYHRLIAELAAQSGGRVQHPLVTFGVVLVCRKPNGSWSAVRCR